MSDFLTKNDVSMLFHDHAKALVVYADSILRNMDDAEETVQELFCSLYKKIPDKSIKNVSMRAFLYVSVRNRAFSMLKRKSAVPLPDSIPDSRNESAQLDNKMTIEAIFNYVQNTANPSSREIFFLRVVNQISWKEVSEITDIPLTSAYRLFDDLLSELQRKFPGVL